ncbi:hypothetical protein K2X30_12545 [bacterium]|jgi:hypothetical protein|nr:hypothetical protein [bacterium]
MKSEPSKFLKYFVTELKARRGLPKHIEISNFGPVCMAGIFNDPGSDIISESVFTGMDFDPDTAVLKGLVEMLERKAFREGFHKGLSSCKTERSDGFAAFPRRIGVNENEAARTNAYHEAVERYVWAKWWDDKNSGHQLKVVAQNQKGQRVNAFLRKLSNIVPVQSVIEISPRIENAIDSHVIIYFAFLNPIGVISGGASGPAAEIELTRFRATCELFRHAVAVKRFKNESFEPRTFYEKRLAYFGMTEEGTKIARDRIETQGVSPIILPELSIDEAMPHEWNDLVAVHRCQFKDQPPFVGGQLERLCL